MRSPALATPDLSSGPRFAPTTLGCADAQVAPTARLLADPARAAMLWALSDGRALPAGELARLGRVGAPAASAHLAKLAAAGLVVAERHGRHRYYRLANPAPLVTALEALAVVAPPAPARSLKEAHAGNAIRLARTCYDHLAGAVGVAITESLVGRGALVLNGRAYEVTSIGAEAFAAFGLDVTAVAEEARRSRRPLTRACLDWSERRYHVAGALGAALASRLIELIWLERIPGGRALRITNNGRRALRNHLDIQVR